FVDGVELERAGFGHVLEAAAEGIVVTDRGPGDAHGRVNGSFDIFRVDVALLRPAVVHDIGAPAIGLSDDGTALDAAACEEGELLRPVIAATLGGDRTYGAAEFTRHHYEGVLEQAGGFEIVQQGGKRIVEDLRLRR